MRVRASGASFVSFSQKIYEDNFYVHLKSTWKTVVLDDGAIGEGSEVGIKVGLTSSTAGGGASHGADIGSVVVADVDLAMEMDLIASRVSERSKVESRNLRSAICRVINIDPLKSWARVLEDREGR